MKLTRYDAQKPRWTNSVANSPATGDTETDSRATLHGVSKESSDGNDLRVSDWTAMSLDTA